MLGKEELKTIVPAAFAQNHDGLRSEQYTFIPTSELLEILENSGWGCFAAYQPGSYKKSLSYKQHSLFFRNISKGLSFVDPLDENSKIYPEIRIVNSSDGTRRLHISAATYSERADTRYILGDKYSFGETDRVHRNFDASEIPNLLNKMVDYVPDIIKNIQAMSEIQLDTQEQIAFATIAQKLRWKDKEDSFDPKELLKPINNAYSGSSLWAVMNTCLVNTLKGGFPLAKRKAREVKNFALRETLQCEFWEVAMNLVIAEEDNK